MRICLVYDCLYPWTVGGAERWMRNLAESLAADGHDVTYVTRRQWPEDDEPRIEGVRVVAVSRDEPLYGPDGNRTIGEPLRFGWGVLRHLARHRGAYDVVHTCSFPYFSLLAARAATAGTPTVLAVDWFEVWTLAYWKAYVGGVRGRVGWLVQRLCARVRQRAFVFSKVHALRLREEGLRDAPITLAGLYAGPLEAHASARAADPPTVLFAGRHIPEKRAPLVAAAVATARERVPDLQGLVLGDGPERPRVLEAIDACGLVDVVQAPGFVSPAEVDAAMRSALCMLLPSSREGFGLVVIEAAAAGTPSVVVAGDDNAAVELIDEGVNGFVAASAEPQAIADAIVRVHEAGESLRHSTTAWFEANAQRLSVAGSIEAVTAAYDRAPAHSSPR